MTTLPGFYKVQKIVGKKVVDGKTLYRVKWLNWPSSTNTYEPIENLQPAIDLVKDYEEKAKQRELQRNSTASTTTLHTQTKPPSPQKNRVRIRKRRLQALGKRPIIFLKTTQRIGTHWVFGNNLAKIIRRRQNGKMMVEWDNGTTSVEPEKDIELQEPELLQRFLNSPSKKPQGKSSP